MSTSTTDIAVSEVMLPLDRIPTAAPETYLKVALEKMTRLRLGVVSIIDDRGTLLGVFTDGDIRRMLLRDQKPFSALFADDVIVHANRTPTVVPPDTKLSEAIHIMEEREVWDLPVVEDGRLVGLLHLHPAIKAAMAVEG